MDYNRGDLNQLLASISKKAHLYKMQFDSNDTLMQS